MAKGEAGRRASRKRYRKRMFWLNALKSEPCMDCGTKYPPECMDFDHRDRSEKKFRVAQAVYYSLTALLAEIAKCDLVCANCHRIRTVRDRRRNA